MLAHFFVIDVVALNNYPLENLGPEKFQDFCQALITSEFPDLQCFPVGQPDGGRDAVYYFPSHLKQGFIVFQIKFVRKPQAEKDLHKWVIDIVNDEAPKIKKLISKGAKKYFLITNIDGTAHLDVGSIDIVNKSMNDKIGIPSTCWWRNDLNRRLDTHWDLKWAYPELMTGPDLIRAIIENGLSENKERRVSTIKAFISDQYSRDEEVKFKQVELQNNLFGLFIDVPLGLNDVNEKRGSTSIDFKQRIIAYEVFRDIGGEENVSYHRDDIEIGAAAFLLHSAVQKNIPKLVIEGAPGQGKSTITQYICQIHRSKILGRIAHLNTLPNPYKASPVRIPFKVDLRDFSSWLARKDPFILEDDDALPANWSKSLESFLCAMVRYHSGGAEFDISDLHAIGKLSPFLIVFDGLDEVAENSRRKDVVDEIVKGVNRLDENTLSLQAIVTSRPTAFANSPGLPESKFPYYRLKCVSRNLIDEYAEKWIKAKKVSSNQGSEIRKILKEKLDQPHIKDLARNPMQLAILLSLVHTRGRSLPDKRTSLYDSYVELFFNREAEKSETVRTYRQLLIDIHQYLGWTLHNETEKGNETGNISAERLQLLLREYLEREGHNPDLAKELFTGMVERVVALISRVQGTYEFEVQPLREYFAARFLYETAPYSPTGAEKRGTKPDIFDAIARNFYWTNVTRFYAGCYSKGELPSLIECLEDLTFDEEFKHLSHPRVLAATLLADWVFTQHQKSVKKVINLILDGIGLRFLVTSISRRIGWGYALLLPEGCGKNELIDHCFKMLCNHPPKDNVIDIIDILDAHCSQDELEEIWSKYLEESYPNERYRWLEYGLFFGILSRMGLDKLTKIIGDDQREGRILALLFKAKREDYIYRSENVFNNTLQEIFCGENIYIRRTYSNYFIGMFASCLNPYRYAVCFESQQDYPLASIWERDKRKNLSQPLKFEADSIPRYPLAQKCNNIIQVVINNSKLPAKLWASELSPWDDLVETCRQSFGDKWIFYQLANIASSIRSKDETCRESDDIYNPSLSLCKRARSARLKSGAHVWWKEKLENYPDNDNKLLSLLLFITWATPKTIEKLLTTLNEQLESLETEQWKKIYNAVKESVQVLRQSSNFKLCRFNLIGKAYHIGKRTVAVLSLRVPNTERDKLFNKFLSDYRGDDLSILEVCHDASTHLVLSRSEINQELLGSISHCYIKDFVTERFFFQRFMRQPGRHAFSIEMARHIALNADKYPGYLIAISDYILKNIVSADAKPIGIVADEGKWFESFKDS